MRHHAAPQLSALDDSEDDDDDDERAETLPSLMQRLLRELAVTPPSARMVLPVGPGGSPPPHLPLPAPATIVTATPAAAPPLPPPHLLLTKEQAPARPLRMLSKDTHLQTALVELPRLASGDGELPQLGDLGGGSMRLPRELRSSSLTQCGDRVDFIAPADNMKQFFKLLHTKGAISLAVHRVGDTLVLEGLEAERWVRGGSGVGGGGGAGAGGAGTAGGVGAGTAGTAAGAGGGGSQEPAMATTGGTPAAGALQLHRKSLQSRFVCYSMGTEHPGPTPTGAGSDEGSGVGKDDADGASACCATDRAAFGDASTRAANGRGADGDDDADDDDDDDDDDDEREAWMPPRRPPRGFRRVLYWQLDELSLLLGSDTVIFRSDDQGRSSLDGTNSAAGYHSPGISVALHDANSTAASMVCLDYCALTGRARALRPC